MPRVGEYVVTGLIKASDEGSVLQQSRAAKASRNKGEVSPLLMMDRTSLHGARSARLGVSKDRLQAEALARLRGQLADEGRSTSGMPAPSPPEAGAASPPAMAGALSSSTSILSRSGRNSGELGFFEAVALRWMLAEWTGSAVLVVLSEVSVTQIKGTKRCCMCLPVE